MSVGSTIKRLRREKGITQEQLGEYLGITSRAISQWECERTAPDISQIGALCHVFDVSSDVLLGIDIEKNNEKIQAYLKTANVLGNQGKREERTALLREANRKFPRNYQIMSRLADSLVCEYSRKGMKEYGEVFELCKRVLAECTDSIVRYETMETLAIAYDYAGKKEEMLKLAEEMPRACFSYENFMVYRWRGNQDFIKRQEYIHDLIHEILSMILCLSGHVDDEGQTLFSYEERKELFEQEFKLLKMFFPDGDYYSFAQYGETVCTFFASDALREGDANALWYWLDKRADFAIHADTYDNNALHTSPLLRGYGCDGRMMESEGNSSQAMIDWLELNEKMIPFRLDDRYIALVKRLEISK